MHSSYAARSPGFVVKEVENKSGYNGNNESKLWGRDDDEEGYNGDNESRLKRRDDDEERYKGDNEDWSCINLQMEWCGVRKESQTRMFWFRWGWWGSSERVLVWWWEPAQRWME